MSFLTLSVSPSLSLSHYTRTHIHFFVSAPLQMMLYGSVRFALNGCMFSQEPSIFCSDQYHFSQDLSTLFAAHRSKISEGSILVTSNQVRLQIRIHRMARGVEGEEGSLKRTI